MDLGKFEQNFKKIISLMEDEKTKKINLDRKYLPELIDSDFWEIKISDDFPSIKLNFELYLNQKGILIEYSELFIHLIRCEIEKWDQYEIVNIVETVSIELEDKLDLKKISQNQENIEYNPEKFPALVLKINDPKATLLIFSTGKMVVTGLRKAEEIANCLDKVKKIFEKTGIKIKNPIITIENVVASENLHREVDLNMAAIVMENVWYEPEVFPGLIFRMQNPKVTFLIFSTGRIVCTGAKDNNILRKAILRLIEILAAFGIFKLGY